MKLFFISKKCCPLASEDSKLLDSVKNSILRLGGIAEVENPREADAIIINERFSFKNWRYIKDLKKDPIIGKYPEKIYTINSDDCAIGILKGIYTSLPKKRFDPPRHRAVPFYSYPNERLFERSVHSSQIKKYLGTWRGNVKSNTKVRGELLATFGADPDYAVEQTESWLNHSLDEKEYYVNLLSEGKFSLCPAGWAPATFRLYESMALGVAPVVIADQFVHPEGPDWDAISISAKESDIPGIRKLVQGREKEFFEMGLSARNTWEKYFSPGNLDDYYAGSLIDCIRNNLRRNNSEKEVKKWNSLKTYILNGWTIPQRIYNKIKRIKSTLEK